MATHAPVNEGIELTAPRRIWLEEVHDWVTTVDHKKIGLMYIGYALFFLVVGGFEAILMRIQLAIPNNHFISPQVFNQLFTMHGTTMVFFMGMPILFGMGNYLVPLMIGARDMAFPRLNPFSFWLSAFAGLDLISPGVVFPHEWNPDPSVASPETTWGYVAAGRKPAP